MPQSPAGFLTIVDLVGQPSRWRTRDVSLLGLRMRFPEDPEPEYVTINRFNEVAVTMQENNLFPVRENEQVHFIVTRSNASFFTSSDGSRAGFLQTAILRRSGE